MKTSIVIPAPIDEFSLLEAERAVILRALQLDDWSVPVAAARLGMGTSTLYRRVQELGIELRGTRR